VRAWEEAIQVIRPTLALDERPMIFELNFKEMVEHKDNDQRIAAERPDQPPGRPRLPHGQHQQERRTADKPEGAGEMKPFECTFCRHHDIMI